MKNFDFKRAMNNTKLLILNCFVEYKLYFCIAIVFMVAGATFGVLTIINTGATINIESITDDVLFNFMKEDSSWLSFLFSNFIETIIIFAIMLFCSCSVFLTPITLFIVFFKTYNYFINITIFFKCLNTIGIFNLIVIIIPCYLISLFILSLFSSFVINLAIKFKDSRCFRFDYINKRYAKKFIIAMIIIKLLVVVYEIIMLSLFCNKFIIS